MWPCLENTRRMINLSMRKLEEANNDDGDEDLE